MDIGLIAETLLFYQKVYLVLDHGSLISLCNDIGIDNLISLIDKDFIQISFMKQSFATLSVSRPPFTFYGFAQSETSNGTKKRISKSEAVYFALKRLDTLPNNLSECADLLSSKIRLEKFHRDSSNILQSSREDLLDDDFTNESARSLVNTLLPDFKIPYNWTFKTIKTVDGISVITNFDFDEINKIYNPLGSEGYEKIDASNVLSRILNARADLTFSSKYNCDLVTNPASSRIIEKKFSKLINKSISNQDEISIFQKTHLDGRNIRDALNSGERTFAEFLQLLEKSKQFRTWLDDAEAETGLLREYYNSAINGSWAGRLPGKSIRFSIFTGLGMTADALFPTGIGTAAGLGLGAADTFLLDRLLKGWKPNHFVDDVFFNFVRS
ncbi:hypothetical protein [Roseibium alexandrii]|uniref:hypothetical protein n=1 Tax=Roseibium alexandrii TaxID=388408 RepID=UPI003752B517